MRRNLFAAASAGALMLVAGAAWTQDAPPPPASATAPMASETIATGQTVEGEIEAGSDADAQAQAQARFYRFEARGGDRFQADLVSDDFDAYLELRAEGSDQVLDWNDDGHPEGLNSRLRFVTPHDGAYVLGARSLGGTEAGRFTLTLTERAAPAADPAATPLTPDAVVEGELADGDAEDAGGQLYDGYVVTLGAGESAAFRLESKDFDALLTIGQGAGDDFDEMGRNDDGPGGGLDSFLVFAAPQAGDYVVRAQSLGGDVGAYVLSRTTPPPPPESQPIAVGDTVEGALTSDDGQSTAGHRADIYTLTATAGQRLRIDVRSGDFDTYLTLSDSLGGVVAEDDDGGAEGTDSRIVHEVEADGALTIEVRAFSDAGEGDYVLTVEEIAPPPPPTDLVVGQSFEGEITEDSPEDMDGRHYQDFRVQGQAGRRLEAILRSGDFDSYLRIGRPDGDFMPLAEDDDGLGEGLDSRLIYAPEEDGDYIVRVSPLGSATTGLFAVELKDRGPVPEPGSILVGAVARGTLDEGDDLSDYGVHFDAYRIRLKAEEKVRIVMASNDFDATVSIGRDGEMFEILATDDDGLSDTHARLDFTAKEDGDYVIHASGFDAQQLGPYILRVEPQP